MSRSEKVKVKNPHIIPYFLLPIFALSLAALACVGSQQLGQLSPAENPVSFTLLGEVDHTWQIDAIPGENYEIVVRNLNSSHPLDQIDISVEQSEEGSAVKFINTPVHYSDTVATTSFTAPNSGTLSVIIYSKIGENQERLGLFSVQLRLLDH